MAKVLKADLSGGSNAFVVLSTLSGLTTPYYITYKVALPAATATALAAASFDRTAWWHAFKDAGGLDTDELHAEDSAVGANTWDFVGDGSSYSGFTKDAYHTIQIAWDGTTYTLKMDGTTLNSFAPGHAKDILWIGGYNAPGYSVSPQIYYFSEVLIGSVPGGSDLFTDGFQSGGLSHWSSTSGSVSLIDDPIPAPPSTDGRVLIAWDDGPLVASPTWTVIDQGTNGFPDGFVSGFDTHVGRQTLIAQTETGTATVYVNDRSGLFDDRNLSSPFRGKLSGRQIMLQIYNPVSAAWEPQFRGLIDDYQYVIDGSAVGGDGNPVNCSIQIDCVDMFDYLNGYLLTPGLDGVMPPAGAEDSIYYAATAGTVDDRIIAVLTNANIDSAMYGSPSLGSGNVKVVETKYNVDESALTAIRDAADAELPFIANCYVDRRGLFQFRGRYGRFAPDDVAAEVGSTWDFTRWKIGDGAAILSDPTRAQIRALEYSRSRQELINSAICYPQALPASGMASQVYADTASITAYGKHQQAPMSDLITGDYAGPGTITPSDGLTQCQLYAELLVKNKKDPRLCPTTVQLKSIQTSDFRASATWDVLTKSDISHIVNIAVGYPGGTGLTGGATADDYYIEGRALTVRAANAAYDYVTLDLEVTPYEWSADTHGVFPAFGS